MIDIDAEDSALPFGPAFTAVLPASKRLEASNGAHEVTFGTEHHTGALNPDSKVPVAQLLGIKHVHGVIDTELAAPVIEQHVVVVIVAIVVLRASLVVGHEEEIGGIGNKKLRRQSGVRQQESELPPS